MQEPKTIFVTGATGRQGSAVAIRLARNGFIVKALARDPGSPSLEPLKKLNIEIIKGNLNDINTFSEHIRNTYGVFCALTFKNGTDTETRQGIALADRAKEEGVSHFIYSSVVAANLHTGVAHWESKYKIENHIKTINLPYTIIRPSSFYENFLIPAVKKRIEKGKFPSPLDKHIVQQFISTDDIGRITAAIFTNSSYYINKEFAVAAEQMDMNAVTRLFSECLGRQVKYQKIPGIIVRLVVGKNIYKMLKWVNEQDSVFVKDLDAFRQEFPGMIKLSDWIRANFS
ncbi:MAG: NmrA/HSCARG family protein [Bacteroidetes bacterium]|nr:NmrA/HSCARG family protein [Bacteroidota bacterium]